MCRPGFSLRPERPSHYPSSVVATASAANGKQGSANRSTPNTSLILLSPRHVACFRGEGFLERVWHEGFVPWRVATHLFGRDEALQGSVESEAENVHEEPGDDVADG